MLNHPIQGTNATIIKRAIARLGTDLSRFEARIIIVVHDEIVLECPAQHAEQIQSQLVHCMKKAADLLNPIPVEVDAKILNCWT